MSGVKGSLKDRIRAWKRRLRIKQENKKKEKQSSFQHHGRVSVFFHTLFGLLIGIFEPKKNKLKDPLRTISIELKQIQEQVKQVKDVKTLEVYEQELQLKKVEIQTLNQTMIQTKQYKQKGIQETYQKCLETLVVTSILMHEKQNQISSKESKIETEEQKSFSYDKGKSNKKLEQKNIVLNQTETVNKKHLFIPETKIEIDKQEESLSHLSQSQEVIEQPFDYKVYIMNTHKKMKAIQKEISEIKEKRNDQSIRYYEQALLSLIHELQQLEKDYQEVSKQKEFQELKTQIEYYKLDSKELLKSDTAIQELLKTCQEEMQWFERKTVQSNPAKSVADKSHESLKEKPKKPVKEKFEKPEKEILFRKDEIESMRLKIMEDLTQQIDQIESFSILPRKKGWMQKIDQFFTNTTAILLSTSFFPNKMLGLLTGSILVHNRVKTMKHMLQKKEANYEMGDITQQLKSKRDCIQTTSYYLNTSLLELRQIEVELYQFHKEQGNEEVEKMLMSLHSLEQTILQRQLEIEQMKERQKDPQKRLFKAS